MDSGNTVELDTPRLPVPAGVVALTVTDSGETENGYELAPEAVPNGTEVPVDKVAPPVEDMGSTVPLERGYGAVVSSDAVDVGAPLMLPPSGGPLLPVGPAVLLLEFVNVSG